MTACAKFAGLLALGLAALPAAALELTLPPSARLTAERATVLGSFDAPVGPFGADGLPVVTLEGRIDRRAWRIAAGSLTPLQLMTPLREELRQLGYSIAFECDASTCGGFDFRFATEVLPGPNMYVNLSQFRYLTAFAGPAGAAQEAVGILVSAADASAYIQVIHADAAATPDTVLSPLSPTEPEPEQEIGEESRSDLKAMLLQNGRIILTDLEFATGTSDLGQGPYPSLARLAEILQADSSLRIALVGHTDTTGSLKANVAVSRARAVSVRERLISVYDVDAAQLDAEGMGYLAPVAPNLTPDGRERNRRVEAVLLNVK